MIHANFGAVLDACVLANYPVCDLFLRLAETPRLYVPHWSEQILAEVRRTHIEKLAWPENIADSWQRAVRTHFPEAMVNGHEPYIEIVKNEAKDRHVAASAIQSKCEVIVTFNLKDFPRDALAPHGIRAEHPSEFLINLYNIDGGVFVSKLVGISSQRQINLRQTVETLAKSLPAFTDFLSESLGLD
jgi:hypothetical protein